MFLLLLLLIACSSSGIADCDAGGTGSLSLTLDLPDQSWAAEPSVRVYSEDGAVVQTVEATETLELPGGLYTLAAWRGTVDSGAIGTAFGLLDNTVTRVCVTDGATTEWSGTWERQPSGEHLWVLSGEAAYGFGPEALDDVESDPAITLDMPLTNDLRGLAFDPMGNLWTATSPTYGARFLVYPPSGVDGSAEPVVVGGGRFDDQIQFEGLQFDESGHLWALVKWSNSVEIGLWQFTTDQLHALLGEGTVPDEPASDVEVEGLEGPDDLAVGPDGRLWIADYGSNRVVAIDGDLVAEGTVTVSPEVSFKARWEPPTGPGDGIGPTALGFDAEGRLWVNYWANPMLARFDSLPTGSDQWTPDLRVGDDVLSLVAGLAPDRNGRVWYGNEPQDGAGELVALDRDDGTETVRVRSADALAPSTLVFDPSFR